MVHLGDIGRAWVAPLPFDVSTPFGSSASAAASQPPHGVAPIRIPRDAHHELSLLFRDHHRDSAPSFAAQARPPDDASSPGLSFPYDTCQIDRPVRLKLPLQSRATCEVWLPPSRPLTIDPTDTRRHRSVPGIHPSRCSPHHDRSPFRGPYPLDVRRAFQPSDLDGRGQLLAEPHRARSPPGPCSRDESVLHRNLAVPAVATFLGFSPPEHAPLRPGTGFSRGCLPSRPPAGQRFFPPGPQGLSAR